MNIIKLPGVTVSLPMPVLVVVEDVGWWRGEDGSSFGQPYRNRFSRSHCLLDYHALVRLARALEMRLVVGMVLGEWDRHNILRQVRGATWQGEQWDNGSNLGGHLDQAAAYLRDNSRYLELACHGLCHEFWRDGRMFRSEFHDHRGEMRAEAVVRSHLEAYGQLLVDNGLPGSRLFLPPALHHGFGYRQSMQRVLRDFGYDTVITSFERMRCRMAPQSPLMAWEHGVRLFERGLSPVAWHVDGAAPLWDFGGPILPLHWSNLLHHDVKVSGAIVDAWAEMLLRGTAGLERLLVPDLQACWDQCAAWSLAELGVDQGRIVIDLRRARAVPGFTGKFFLKATGPGLPNLPVPGEQLGADPRGSDCRVFVLSSDEGVVSIDGEKGLMSSSERLPRESFVLPLKVL